MNLNITVSLEAKLCSQAGLATKLYFLLDKPNRII